jgi:hypothetical protein
MSAERGQVDPANTCLVYIDLRTLKIRHVRLVKTKPNGKQAIRSLHRFKTKIIDASFLVAYAVPLGHARAYGEAIINTLRQVSAESSCTWKTVAGTNRGTLPNRL